MFTSLTNPRSCSKDCRIEAQKVRWESARLPVCVCYVKPKKKKKAKLPVLQDSSQSTKTKMVWEEGQKSELGYWRWEGTAHLARDGTLCFPACKSCSRSQAGSSVQAHGTQADNAQAKNTFEKRKSYLDYYMVSTRVLVNS